MLLECRWGTLWGVPGLVLAVPLTAVLKVHLATIDHPLPRLVLRLLDGRRRGLDIGLDSAAGTPRADSDELLPLHEDHEEGHALGRAR